jgi:hypothetical protein
VNQQSNVTLAEFQTALVTGGGPAVSRTLIWQWLAAHDLRRKKSVHAAERGTKRVKPLRGTFPEAIQDEGFTCFNFVSEADLCPPPHRPGGGRPVRMRPYVATPTSGWRGRSHYPACRLQL